MSFKIEQFESGDIFYLDEQDRFHREDGPAVIMPATYHKFHHYLKGIYFNENLYYSVVNKTLTVEQIDEQWNTERRRLLIEYYGLERYIKDSKLEIIAKNKYGIIYKKEQRYTSSIAFISETLVDEPIVVVKVKNSTPEIDGSYKNYFIRVPPHFGIKKYKWLFFRDNSIVQDAIAWTFGLTKEEYIPNIET